MHVFSQMAVDDAENISIMHVFSQKAVDDAENKRSRVIRQSPIMKKQVKSFGGIRRRGCRCPLRPLGMAAAVQGFTV